MPPVSLPAAMALQDSVLQNRPMGRHRLFGDAENYYEAIARDPNRYPWFEQFIGTYTQVNRDRVASLPLFSRCRRILDVGGNNGEMALAIARLNPGCRVTVYDFPAVVEKAEERFRAAGLSDRLDTIGGDILERALPAGYDCILYSHVVEMFSPARYTEMLRRAFDALPSGGGICIFSPVVFDDETGPLVSAVFSSYFLFLANGEGKFHSVKSISGWMADIGFREITRHRLPMYEVVLAGTRP